METYRRAMNGTVSIEVNVMAGGFTIVKVQGDFGRNPYWELDWYNWHGNRTTGMWRLVKNASALRNALREIEALILGEAYEPEPEHEGRDSAETMAKAMRRAGYSRVKQ